MDEIPQNSDNSRPQSSNIAPARISSSQTSRQQNLINLPRRTARSTRPSSRSTYPTVVMPASVIYTPNSQPEPTLLKDNPLHKSGFHLLPNTTPRRILSKRILSGGSISFLLGTLSSLYDTSSPEIIEVSAEVIGDYVAWEDLQAFEHAEFEKELAENSKEKEEYEMPELTQMMGATVKRPRGQPTKSKKNFLGTASSSRRNLTDVIEDSDTKASKSQSPASSSGTHSGIVKRARGRPRKDNQVLCTVIRPGTKLKNVVADLEKQTSESEVYDSLGESHVKIASGRTNASLKSRSSGMDLVNSGDAKEGPKSVARAPIAKRFTRHFRAKQSMAMDYDGTKDDAKDNELVTRQIMNESKMLVDSDHESEERVDLLRQFQKHPSVDLSTQESSVGKTVTANIPARTQATAYMRYSSGSTTDTDSEPSARSLRRQPQVQMKLHRETGQALEPLRQDDDIDEDDLQPQHRRYRSPYPRIIHSSNNKKESDGDDDPPRRSQNKRNLPPPMGYFRKPDNNEDDDDYDDGDRKKSLSKAEVLLKKFQQHVPIKGHPSSQPPHLKKFMMPSSIKPLNPTSSHQLPTHSRSGHGPLIERVESSTPPATIVRQPPLSLNKTLLSPSKSPSMTTPFPGPGSAAKKPRLDI